MLFSAAAVDEMHCNPMRHCLYLFAHDITYKKHVIGAFYGDDVLFIIDDMSWASWIIIDGEEILGGLLFIFPLEGNTFAAHDHHTLHTCHKWRRGKQGASYKYFHDQIFSPPSLPELKVERDFYELPCWEATYVIWMIAWGWEIHLGMMSPIIYQI